MKILKADGREEFILHKFWTFYEKSSISIKYATPYIHKKNRLTKQEWCTIVTMKNLMLIDTGLPNGFWAKAIGTANYLQNKLSIKSKNHGEMILKKA